jgi:hypothetical protein
MLTLGKALYWAPRTMTLGCAVTGPTRQMGCSTPGNPSAGDLCWHVDIARCVNSHLMSGDFVCQFLMTLAKALRDMPLFGKTA